MNAAVQKNRNVADAKPENWIAREKFRALEGRPALLSNWEGVTFIHFAVPAQVLQPHVPFELDVRDGTAWVSVVVFTMTQLRPAFGGKLAALLFRPFRSQRFLNLRTYVRHGDESGIYFLAEWMSDWLCTQIGPWLYGLPYRWGRHEFEWNGGQFVRGNVQARDGTGAFSFEAVVHAGDEVNDEVWRGCESGSRDEFLLERYTAFTWHHGPARLFRIWHEPWLQRGAEAVIKDDSLIRAYTPWWNQAEYAGTSFSPGAFDIWMGRPRRVEQP